jgi:hypothetical protein
MKTTIDHDALTPTDILRWMAPDREYRSPEIAAHFGVRSLWTLLQRMAKAGDIAKTRGADDSWAWSLIPKRAEPLHTSVAGPATGPDLTRTLGGYDADMRRRIDLAMSVRRAS